MYITRQIKIPKTNQLDFLAHEAGIVYSQTLVYYKRILRKKNIWLSKYTMQRLISGKTLHSQTRQGIVEIFYDNLTSWRELRKTDKTSRMPRKRKWFFVLPYKKSAIKLKDNKLILSNGKNNPPLIIDWKFELPVFVRISYDNGYIVNATYSVQTPENNNTEVAGIDLGEIHLAVANVGNKTLILNGRKLRSKRRYQNKVKAYFQSKLSKHKKNSRKYKKINNKKKEILKRLDNQIKDIVHKQTTKLVYALNKLNVKTVAIGDVKNIRQNVDYGRHANQKIHQMLTGKVRAMLEYKCAKYGIDTHLINESYSSQTCPSCLHRHKPSNRQYKCSKCGFVYHRDGVGAINIRNKYMYKGYVPVVGVMTPPVGIRYTA